MTDRVATLASFLILPTPIFLMAVLLKVGAYQLNLAAGTTVLYYAGERTPGLQGGWWQLATDRVQHLVLPTLAIVLVQAAFYSRYQRNAMLDVLGSDFLHRPGQGATAPPGVLEVTASRSRRRSEAGGGPAALLAGPSRVRAGSSTRPPTRTRRRWTTRRDASRSCCSAPLELLAQVPSLLVLSACDGGLAAVAAGDGLMGLTSALLGFGARNVVAGVTAVPDDLTRQPHGGAAPPAGRRHRSGRSAG